MKEKLIINNFETKYGQMHYKKYIPRVQFLTVAIGNCMLKIASHVNF